MGESGEEILNGQRKSFALCVKMRASRITRGGFISPVKRVYAAAPRLRYNRAFENPASFSNGCNRSCFHSGHFATNCTNVREKLVKIRVIRGKNVINMPLANESNCTRLKSPLAGLQPSVHLCGWPAEGSTGAVSTAG